MKILSQYRNALLLIVVGVNWTDPFQTVLQIGGATTFIDSNYLSTDCVFQTSSFYLQFLFFAVVPFVVLLLTALIHWIIYLFEAFIIPCIKGIPRESE